MKLGINGWRMVGTRTGVGRYLFNIVRHWTPDVVGNRFQAIRFYTHRPLDNAQSPLPPNIQQRVMGPPWRMLLWENLRLGPTATEDVFYHPSFSIPLIRRGKSVVVIHEVVHEMHPQLFPPSVRLFYRHLYRWSARQATLVISGSEASKQDVARYMGIPAGKIHVVPMAPAEFFRQRPEPAILDQVQRDYLDPQTPYFLFVGKLSGRRSIPLLLGGFARFKQETGLPHKLVVVGLNTRKLDVAQMLDNLGISGEVIYPGFVSDEVLNALYHGAQALISPAIYEPICLPVMEAQAAGTPVVCSDSAGMREATGGHAMLLPRPDVAEMAAALTQLAGDAALRRHLAECGLAHSQQFSWQRTATLTLDVLAQAVQQ